MVGWDIGGDCGVSIILSEAVVFSIEGITLSAGLSIRLDHSSGDGERGSTMVFSVVERICLGTIFVTIFIFFFGASIARSFMGC